MPRHPSLHDEPVPATNTVEMPSAARSLAENQPPVRSRWRAGIAWARGQTRRRWLRRVALGWLILMVLATGVFAFAWQRTPATADLATWVRQQVVLHHGQYAPLSTIAPMMRNALIAVEDERFYQHHGIDTLGLMRAAWDDLRAGKLVEGGSTLTGQLAKNAYLQGNDHTFPRKLEDLLLAIKIEHRYSKGQILEMYLNLVYFGNGAYGIGAAAHLYFGVAPSQLNIAESAVLAGLVQAPSYYNPFCSPANARDRQGEVLTRMVADGYITPTEATLARQVPMPPMPPHDAYCSG